MLTNLMFWLKTRDEEGQGLMEYAIIIALVAIVVIVGMGLLGVNLNLAFDALADWVAAHITAAIPA